MKSNRKKGGVFRPLLTFIIGIALIWFGLPMLENPQAILSFNYQPQISNGSTIILLGIGFIIGAFLQLRNLGKEEDDINKKKKKRKNKKLY